jgi:DNA-directed RNA polymerase specialized sigma24 family protein
MTEAELLARAKAGSQEAFNSLVGASLPKIHVVVWRMVGHPEDTENVGQTALAKSRQGIGTF